MTDQSEMSAEEIMKVVSDHAHEMKLGALLSDLEETIQQAITAAQERGRRQGLEEAMEIAESVDGQNEQSEYALGVDHASWEIQEKIRSRLEQNKD